MKYEVNISAQAENDLRGIFEYIAFVLQSAETASRQLEQLEKGIFSLEYMPERFRSYEREPWKSRGLRLMPVNNYIVFYIPDDKGRIVNVVRVIYAGRDIDKQLSFI